MSESGMSLVVGHNCPGCGLDTPQAACAQCGAPVVWDRDNGSHCGACGLSASTITCGECGLRAELDKRHDEYRPDATAPSRKWAEPDDESDEAEGPASRRLIAWAGTVPAASPVWRTLAIIVLAIGAHGLIVGLLVAGRGEPGQAGGYVAAGAARDMAAAASGPFAPSGRSVRTSAGQQSRPGGTALLPVPVQPPRPAPADASSPNPRFALSPPPTEYVAPPPVAQAPARREGWLQRVLRAGRTPPAGGRFETIHADSAGGGR